MYYRLECNNALLKMGRLELKFQVRGTTTEELRWLS